MSFPRKINQFITWVRPWFAANIASSLMAGGMIIIQAYLLSQVINRVHLENATLQQLMPLLWILLGIILSRAILAGTSDIFGSRTAAGIKEKLREYLMQAVVRQNFVRRSKEETGELATVVVEGVEALDAYFSQYLPQLVIAVLLPVTILFVIFPIDILSGIIFLVTAPLIPVFMILIGKTGEILTKHQWNLLSRLSTHFLDTIQGLEELKRLNQSLEKTEEIRKTSFAYARITISVLRVTFLSALVLEMVGTISTALVAVQIGLRLLNGGIPFQLAFFILVVAPEFYFPLRQLGVRFHAGMTGRTAAVRIFELLLPDENREPSKISIQKYPDIRKSPIIFRDVSYRYLGREVDAVHQVNFILQPGKLTALVGRSGSGKTTLSSLLLGFLMPQEGTVLVDGTPLSDLPIDWWRSQTAWVPQQPTLFAGTLRENICIGKPEASESMLWDAIQKANLAEFVESQFNGLESNIYETGRNLSSGQIQRIALARAFLRDAPVLVMDEPTAHLDPDLEKNLNAAILELVKNRTVLVIAHRMPTILRADQVVLLDAGKVVETGSPVSLLEQGGYFASMVQQLRAGNQLRDITAGAL